MFLGTREPKGRSDRRIGNEDRVVATDHSRAPLGPSPYALPLSLNLVKLLDRAPERAFLTSPEGDHAERPDNQER